MWNLVDSMGNVELDASHVVWMLASMSFLRIYPTTHVLATTLGHDEKTVRKYVWMFTEYLARLEVVCRMTQIKFEYLARLTPLTNPRHCILLHAIHYRSCLETIFNHERAVFTGLFIDNDNGDSDSHDSDFTPATGTEPHPTSSIDWDYRFINDNGSRCKVSVDGTDFRIWEPRPFNKKWYSSKFNGPGVRYEVGVCIQTGWIVWTNGPFPCGEWSDVKIALDGIVYMLEGDERLIADKGYRGHPCYFDCPWKHLDNVHQRARKAIVRASYASTGNSNNGAS
jgi:hypothetical protein